MLRHVIWLLLCAWLSLSAPASMAQSPGDCDTSDVTNEESVFQCMASLRAGTRPDTRLLDPRAIQDCSKLIDVYVSIARRSGVAVPRGAEGERVPSCAIMARVMERMSGKRPVWASCANYPGRFEADHMKACLSEFLPRFYGGARTLESLRGCPDALGEYQRALSFATARHERAGGPPAGFMPPSCEVLETAGIVKPSAVVATAPAPTPDASTATPAAAPVALPPVVATLPSTACGNYEPTRAHLERCLGGSIGSYTDCRALRSAYVAKLRQDHGGLPSGYQPPPCDELNPIVEQNQARRNVRPPPPPPPPSTPSMTAEEMLWAFVGWLNGRAFAIHIAVFAAAAFYTRHLMQTGKLFVPKLSVARVFFNSQVNRWLLVAHIAAGAIGYQYFSGGTADAFPKWIASAGAALIVASFGMAVLIFTPFFSGGGGGGHGPSTPGPTQTRPRSETPPPKQRTSKQRGDTF